MLPSTSQSISVLGKIQTLIAPQLVIACPCAFCTNHIFFNTFKRQQIVNFAKITNYHEVYMEKKNNIDYKIILVLVYLPRHRRVLILLDQTGTVELMTVEGS